MTSPRILRGARRGAAASLLLFIAGCAAATAGRGTAAAPAWPYAGIIPQTDVPPVLADRPVFGGRWIASSPDGASVYTDAADPRYLIRIRDLQRHQSEFFDLGDGAVVENVGFLPQAREAILVAGVISPHSGGAVVARAVLEMDLDSSSMTAAFALSRDGVSRGMDLDPYRRRVFLLDEAGGGEGVVRVLDLYRGAIVRRAPVGLLPVGVGRKGLAVDENVRRVFCLSGGTDLRSDFQPVGPDTTTRGPELLVLDPDSLIVTSRLTLDRGLEPRALVYDRDRAQMLVLLSSRERSRVLFVDAAYNTVEARVDLPAETTDLVTSSGYAFCPGSDGIYILDLAARTWAGRSAQFFDLTTEMAVSAGDALAFVLYQPVSVAGTPTVGVVDLRSGALLENLK